MAAPSSLSIGLPLKGFRRYLFFNRFAVERDQDHTTIHFGLLSKSGAFVHSYSTIIFNAELEAMRKTVMDYLGGQGSLGDPPPAWQPSSVEAVEVCSHMVLAHHGPIAETICHIVSYWGMIDVARKLAKPEKGKTSPTEHDIVAEPLALLRSTLAVQQHLIRLLFKAEGDLLIP